MPMTFHSGGAPTADRSSQMTPREREAQRRRIRDHAEAFLRQLAEDDSIPAMKEIDLARNSSRDTEGISCWLVYVACVLAGGSKEACTEQRERCEEGGLGEL
jgi:hypothetical protein